MVKQGHAWADRVQAQAWGEAYVFFKHEDAGTGPKLAARFMEFANAAHGPPGPAGSLAHPEA